MQRTESRRGGVASFISDFSPLDKKARQLFGRRSTAQAARAWAESLEIRRLLSATLAIAMSGPTAPVPLGGQAIYQLGVANNGSDDALDVQIDVFANLASSVFPSPTITQLSGPTFSQPFSSREQLSDLPGGASATFQVVQPVPTADAFPQGTPTSFTESALAAGLSQTLEPTPQSSPLFASVNVVTPVAPTATLQALISAPSRILADGGAVPLTLTAVNHGPSAVQDASMVVTLPPQLSFASLNQTSGAPFTVTGTDVTDGTTVITATGSLPAGSLAMFQLNCVAVPSSTVAVPFETTINLSGQTVNGPAISSTANAFTQFAHPIDLSVNLSGDTAVLAGTARIQQFNLSIDDIGLNQPQSATLSYTMPAGYSLVSLVGYSGPGAPVAGATGTFTIPITLPKSRGEVQLTINEKVSASAPNGAVLTHTAVVTTTPDDSDPTSNTATVNTTIFDGADAAVTQTGPASVVAGTDATYNFTVSNGGPSNANNLHFIDSLPAGMSFVSVTQTSGPTLSFTTPPVGSSGDVTADMAVMPPLASATFQLVAHLSSQTQAGTGSIVNTGTVSTTSVADYPGNNSATVTSDAQTQADIGVAVAGAANAVAGTDTNFTITLTNSGPSDAQNIVLSSALPASEDFVSFTVAPGGPFVSAGLSAGNTLSFNVGYLPAGEVATLTITTHVNPAAPAGQPLVNSVTASSGTPDPNAANNAASASTPVSAMADLSVTVARPSGIAPPLVSGDLGTFNISVTNHGPSAAQNVVMNDVLPAGARLVSLTEGSQKITPVVDGSGDVQWVLPTLPALVGASAQFQLTYQLGDGSRVPTLTDTISASSDTLDQNPANNSASTSFTMAPGTVTVSGPNTWRAGTTASYVIEITAAPGSGGGDSVLSVTVPEGTVINSVLMPPGLTVPPGVVGSAGTVYIPLIVPATGSFNLVVHELIDSSVADGTILVTSATMGYDPTTTATASTRVVAQADLAISLAGSMQLTAGTNDQYTLTVINNGPSSAENLTITDILPSAVQLISITSPGTWQSSNPPGGPLTITIPRLGAQATQTFTLAVAVLPSAPNGSTAINQATVSSTTTDPISTNNSASLATPVVAMADITASISLIGQPAFLSGQRETLLIPIGVLSGPSEAENVMLTDVLPPGATVIGLSNATGATIPVASSAGNTVSWQLPPISVGPGVTYSLTYQLGTVGQVVSFSDTATVTSNAQDPNTANNSATWSLTLAPSSLSFNGTPVFRAGTTASYILNVTGTSTSGWAAVSLNLPPGMTLASVLGPPGVVMPTFPRGTTGTFTVPVPVSTSSASQLVFRDLIGASVPNGTVLVQTAETNYDPSTIVSTSTMVLAQADLGVTLVGPSAIDAGGNAAYSLTVNNNGPSDAQGVSFNDLLPPGMTFISASQTGGPTFTLTTPLAGGSGTITGTIATLPANASATFQLVAQLISSTPAGSTVVNTVNVTSATTDPVSSNNSASASSTVQTDANLSVSLSGANAVAGTNETYNLSVTNIGPSAAQNVVLNDILPGAVGFVSLTSNGSPPFNCGAPHVGGTGTVTIQLPQLLPGGIGQYILTVSVPSNAAPGMLTSTVTATSDTNDPNPANNTLVLNKPVTFISDLSVLVTAPLVAVTTNSLGTEFLPIVLTKENATFTIDVANAGSSDAANVVITNPIPTGATFISVQQVFGPTINFVPPSAGSASLLGNIPVLAAGQSAEFTVTYNVSGLNRGDLFTDMATIASASIDLNHANNSSTAVASVDAPANLVAGIVGQTTFRAGTFPTYFISVTNSGDIDAAGATVNFTIPADAPFNHFGASSGFAPLGTLPVGTTGVVSFTLLPGLKPGTSATLAIQEFIKPSVPQGEQLVQQESITNTAADDDPTDNSATFTTTVFAIADVAVGMTGPATVRAGDNASYSVTVTNNGPADAQNVSLVDLLPPGLTFVSATQTSGPAFTLLLPPAGAIAENIATLPVNASATFQIVAQVASSALDGSSVANTVTASATTTDFNSANNSATASTAVSTSGDVAVMLTAPAMIVAGNSVSYGITVSNNGPSDGQTVSFSDIVPSDMTFSSITQVNGPTFTLMMPTAGGTGIVAGNIATLPAHSSATFNFVANVSSSAMDSSLVNTVTVTSPTSDPNSANNTASASSTLMQQADLAVSMHALGPATPGLIDGLAFTVTNNGPSDAQNVVVTTMLPTSETFYYHEFDGPVVLVNVIHNPGAGDTLVMNIPSMPAHSSRNISIFLHVVDPSIPDGSSIHHTLSVSSDTTDPNTANNSASIDTPVVAEANLTVRMHGSASFIAGTDVGYTFSITNNGPSDAHDVQFVDVLPAGVSFISASQTSASPFLLTLPAVGSFGATISGSISTLPVGSIATFAITAHLPASAAPGSILTSTVSATDPAQLDSSGSTATTVDTVRASADVGVTISSSGTAVAGASKTYTLVVFNNGPSDAHNVAFTDFVPAGMTFVSLTQTGGPAFTLTTPPSGPAGAVTGNIATLLQTSSIFQLVLRPASSAAAGSTIRNGVTITSSVADPNLSNNTSAVTSTVTTQADLGVSITAPSNPVEGQPMSYSIAITNNGPSDGHNVVATDSLPPGLTFTSAQMTSGPSATISGPAIGTNGTLTFTLPTLAAGTSGVFQLTVMPSDEGSFANSVSVSTTTPDPSTANNTASVTTVVSDAPPTASGKPLSGVEGSAVSGTVATFQDGNKLAPAGDFTATINWGDGSTSSGAIVSDGAGNFHVTGSHTYALFGNYPTSVTITDDGGSTASATGSAAVSDAPLTGFGQTLVIDKKAVSGVVGQFADGNALNNDPNQYTAFIDWGDGMITSGTIARDSTTGRWDVLGDHRYAKHGTYAISILVADTGSQSVRFTSTALVINPGDDQADLNEASAIVSAARR